MTSSPEALLAAYNTDPRDAPLGFCVIARNFKQS
jgi:hypothetical protein